MQELRASLAEAESRVSALESTASMAASMVEAEMADLRGQIEELSAKADESRTEELSKALSDSQKELIVMEQQVVFYN